MWAFAREQEIANLAKVQQSQAQQSQGSAENAESVVQNLARPKTSLLYSPDDDCFITIPLLSDFEAQHMNEIKAMMKKFQINTEIEDSDQPAAESEQTQPQQEQTVHVQERIPRTRRNSFTRQNIDKSSKSTEESESEPKQPQQPVLTVNTIIKPTESTQGTNFANQYVYSLSEKRVTQRPTRKDILSQTFPDSLVKVNFGPITNPKVGMNKGLKSKKEKSITEEYIIEKILGVIIIARNKTEKYFVKYIDAAYLHCDLLTSDEVLLRKGGKGSLKDFDAARAKHPLIRSFILPNLLVLDNSELEPMWFNIERIIDESNDDNRLEFLAKWRGLDYEQSTWESKTFIRSQSLIEQYKQHIEGTNKRKIPSRWKRPTEKDFSPVKNCDDSLTGLILSDEMTGCINFIISGYFRKVNVIHADVSPRLQRYQIAASFDYLTDQTKFNGPILLLTDEFTLASWKDAFDEWTGFNSIIYSGTEKALTLVVETEFNVVDSNGRFQNSLIQADVVITPFNTYRDNQNVFEGIEWRVLLIDSTKFSKFDKKWLSNINSEYIVITIPQLIKQDLSKYYEILQFANPSVFKDSKQKFFAQFDSSDANNCRKLAEFVKPYIIEHTERTEETDYHMIEVEPSPQQVSLAMEIITNAKDVIMSSSPENYAAQRFVLSILRFISDHPALVNSSLDSKEVITQSGKFVFIDKILRSRLAERKKICIFSEIPDSLLIVGQMLEQSNIKYMKATFNQPDDEINSYIDSFDADESVRVFLYASKRGARRIDTSVFDRIILLDDDTYRLRSGPKIPIWHLVTRGFPDEALYSRNLCYEQSSIFTAPPEGPLPPHSSVMSSFILSTMYKLSQVNQKDYSQWNNHTAEDIIKKSRHANVGNRLIPISEQFNFFLKKVENTTQTSDVVTSILDIGPRTNFAAKCIRSALIEKSKKLDVKERDLLKSVVKKLSSTEEDGKFLVDNEYISKYANDIIDRTFLFLNIQRALFILTEFTLMATFENIPVANVYCLLYSVYANGLKESFNSLDKSVFDLQNEENLVALITKLVEQINSTYSTTDESFYFDYIPLPPERWSVIIKTYMESRNMNPQLNNLNVQIPENKETKEVEKPNDRDVEQLPQSAGELDRKIMINLHRHPFEPFPQRNDKLISDTIFNTILDRGFPINQNSEVLWKDFCGFVGLNMHPDRVKDVACEIVKQCVLTMQSMKEFDPADSSLLKDLTIKINIHSAKNLILTVRAMSLIYSISQQSFASAMKKVPKHPSLPTWWTGEHCEALINLMRQNGTFAFFKWIVDDKLPFASHIKKHAMNLFMNTAALEEKGELKASDVPNKLGDFTLLVKRRFRIGIALWMIDQAGKIMTSSVRNEDDTLRIVSFGRIVNNPNFNGPYCPYPVGYVAERLLKVSDGEPQWYRCEISAEAGKPLFTVSPVYDPIKEWVGSTPKEAWTRVFGRAKKGETIKYSGLWLFGLVGNAAMNNFKSQLKSDSYEEVPDGAAKSLESAADLLTKE